MPKNDEACLYMEGKHSREEKHSMEERHSREGEYSNEASPHGQYNLKELRKAMKEVQSSKRFEHTKGVEYTSAALAMRYGASMEDALAAGLLHDCAKCLSDDKQLSICEKQGLFVTETEKRNPFLLHSKVGAYLAWHKYGIKNQDVLNAVHNHTTGRPGMSLLEKIVFVADYIEPGRKEAANLTEIRRLAFQDLDRALLKILEDTLEYLEGRGSEADHRTRETWEYYHSLYEDKGEAKALQSQ